MFTAENAREMQARSAEARRERKNAREITKALLEGDYMVSAKESEMLTKLGYADETTALTMLIVSMYKQAMSGSTKAFELLLGLLGENPAKKVEIEGNGFVEALNNIAETVCTEEGLNDN